MLHPYYPQQFNPPFPHIDAFWCLYSRQLLKTWCQKEKLHKTSNFSFCQYVFNFFQYYSSICKDFSKLSAAALLYVGKGYSCLDIGWASSVWSYIQGLYCSYFEVNVLGGAPYLHLLSVLQPLFHPILWRLSLPSLLVLWNSTWKIAKLWNNDIINRKIVTKNYMLCINEVFWNHCGQDNINPIYFALWLNALVTGLCKHTLHLFAMWFFFT